MPVNRLDRIMSVIDDERSRDKDPETDIDFMNAIINELENRIERAEEDDAGLDGDDEDDDEEFEGDEEV